MPPRDRKPFDASLVPEPEPEGPESVGELTRRITNTLEVEFPQVWVVGEVSNFKRHTSGHLFFSLKDDRAALRCVMWRSTAERLKHEVADGTEVEARGRISVYAQRGDYQLYVSSLKPRGMGALEVAFRKLKEKLASEGLFDPAHKKPLPRFPRRIGVVTSETGAAVRDIIHVLTRRWPAAAILLAPARVQGEGAGREIIGSIENLNRIGGVDVLIVGRGGGSLEDLWAFNEEPVARAIFASEVPVVSAVGHETDFSISDFVADVRAPTPSAAAEIVAPDRREIAAGLDASLRRMGRQMSHRLQRAKDRVDVAARSRYLAHPEELALARVQEVEDLARRMAAGAAAAAASCRLRIERAAAALSEYAPRALWLEARAAVRMAGHRLEAAGRTMLVHRWKARVDGLAARLEDLSPDRVLARGYSRTVLERTGATLRRGRDARPGDTLRTILAEGEVTSEVRDVRERRGQREEQGTAKEEVKGPTAKAHGKTTKPKRQRPPRDDGQGALFD